MLNYKTALLNLGLFDLQTVFSAVPHVLFLLAFGLLLAVLGFAVFNYLNSPPGPPSFLEQDHLRLEYGNILFLEVRSGESGISVGRRLEEAGII